MAKRGKRPTVSDIAKRAGVSVATVSRVMNNTDYPVRAELRARVLEAASQLDYNPNLFAQAKGGTRQEIGVIVPSIANPFYSQVVSAVETECLRRGYAPVICSSQNAVELERRHMENLDRKRVDGVLVSCLRLTESQLELMDASVREFVLFDQSFPTYQGDCVTFDFFGAGYMATKHLLDCGHREIAFVSGPMDRPGRNLYFDGFRRALRDAGVRMNNRRVVLCNENPAEGGPEACIQFGRELGSRLMQAESLPDALVAADDMIAVSLMQYLKEQGVEVPRDISIIGFGDVYFSSLMGLTTVSQSPEEMGRLSAKLLLDRLEGEDVEENRIVMQPKLVERDTVRKLHKKVRR